MTEHMTTEGLTEAEREALATVLPASEWDYDPDRFKVEAEAVVERILAERLAAVQAERDGWRQYAEERWDQLTIENSRRHAAEAERDALRKQVGALADDWDAPLGDYQWFAGQVRAALEERQTGEYAEVSAPRDESFSRSIAEFRGECDHVLGYRHESDTWYCVACGAER